MNKLTRISAALLIFSLFAAGTYVFTSRRATTAKAQSTPSQAGDPSRPLPQFNRINEKARAARSNDEAAVGELTDAVFSTLVPDSDPVGRAATAGLRDRVLRSEMEYRKGKRKGVDEIEVVKVVNGLAKKFGAPDYAKTDQREVRELRVSMLTTEGDFVGRGKNDRKSKKRKKGDSIGSEMSPLEAVYVTADLMKQKMYSEDYQLTQEERRARWAERHSGVRKKCEGEGCGGKIFDSPRYKEMQDVSRKATRISPIDALDTAHQALNVLGIDR